MPVGHSQSMYVRISTQTLFGRSNHMPHFCGGKTLRPNVIWRHAMTSLQATLTTEPPFSATPWRTGEYTPRYACFTEHGRTSCRDRVWPNQMNTVGAKNQNKNKH